VSVTVAAVPTLTDDGVAASEEHTGAGCVTFTVAAELAAPAPLALVPATSIGGGLRRRDSAAGEPEEQAAPVQV